MPGILRINVLAFEVDHDRSQFFAYVPQEPLGQPWSGRLHRSLEVYCLERRAEKTDLAQTSQKVRRRGCDVAPFVRPFVT